MTPAVASSPVTHWYVVLTVAGTALLEAEVSAALQRLLDERPLMDSCRYSRDMVELRYWEQAPDVQDAAAMALRLWGEHRRSAQLPDWRVVGLEVVDRETFHRRLEMLQDDPAVSAAAEIRPL